MAEVHIELYQRAVQYLGENSVPLPVDATKPEMFEEVRVFVENAYALDIQSLCIPGGKLAQFPVPYLIKLLAAAFQHKDASQADELKEANAQVRADRGVTGVAPGGNPIPERKV